MNQHTQSTGGEDEIIKKFGNDLAFQLPVSNDSMQAVRLVRKMLPDLLAQKEREVREDIFQRFDISGDPQYQEEQIKKQQSIEGAIKNKEVVYLSQFGHILTEDMYLEFEEWADSVMPMGEGHQKEKCTRIDLSTLKDN